MNFNVVSQPINGSNPRNHFFAFDNKARRVATFWKNEEYARHFVFSVNLVDELNRLGLLERVTKMVAQANGDEV